MYIQYNFSKLNTLGTKEKSSLERVPDYRGFGLERFHCILYSLASCMVYAYMQLFRRFFTTVHELKSTVLHTYNYAALL